MPLTTHTLLTLKCLLIFFLRQDVPPLTTRPPPALVFLSNRLWMFSPAFSFCFNSKLSQTWHVFDFLWSSALSQGMTAGVGEDIITEKLLIQSLASIVGSVWIPWRAAGLTAVLLKSSRNTLTDPQDTLTSHEMHLVGLCTLSYIHHTLTV